LLFLEFSLDLAFEKSKGKTKGANLHFEKNKGKTKGKSKKKTRAKLKGKEKKFLFKEFRVLVFLDSVRDIELFPLVDSNLNVLFFVIRALLYARIERMTCRPEPFQLERICFGFSVATRP